MANFVQYSKKNERWTKVIDGLKRNFLIQNIDFFYRFQRKRSSMKTLEQDCMICASRENATRMYFIYYELFALHFCTNLARQIVVKLF